ncbi:MAG TPA: hypothetical protein VHC22_32725 [Pirellulales bacterium]|nr:hypothetical protein [Pirellulales bacterium]
MFRSLHVGVGLILVLASSGMMSSRGYAQTRDTFRPEAHELSHDEVADETAADLEEEEMREDDDDEDETPAPPAAPRRANRRRAADTRERGEAADTFRPAPTDLTADEVEEHTKQDLEREQADSDRPGGRRASSPRPRPKARSTRDKTDSDADRDTKPSVATASAKRGAGGRRSTAQQFQITLNNAFIEKYKNRVTLSTDFRVLGTRVHKAAEDADEHIAGIADEVGLPCVAEIMNAREQTDALTAVKDAKDSGDPTKVTGAWRIWCEHPGKNPQVQNDPIPDFKTSNPDHVFEIHPVSRFGDIDVRESFHPIDGYEPKEAKRAFTYYESLPCQIVPHPQSNTTTIVTVRAVFNYVEFVMQVEEDQQFATIDGRIVRCSALDLEDKVVATDRRMVCISGTEPEDEIKGLKKGDTLHVLGIPRIDLAVVSWRIRHAADRPEALTWDLPYEIIVVGVYKDE